MIAVRGRCSDKILETVVLPEPVIPSRRRRKFFIVLDIESLNRFDELYFSRVVYLTAVADLGEEIAV